jgi:hypothetical protein
MKNIMLLLFLNLLLYSQSHSQAIDIKNDTAIYKCLIKRLGIENPGINDTIAIFYKTSLKSLKLSDFKKTPLIHWVLPLNRRSNSPVIEGMKEFLDQIDINNLSEQELTVKIGKHPFKKIEYKTYRDRVMDHEFSLTFSPVIYSADKKMALCSVDQYYGFNDGSQAIYLLMFRNGKWELVRALGLGFS